MVVCYYSFKSLRKTTNVCPYSFENTRPVLNLYPTDKQKITMEIPKTYDPSRVEEKWYQYWLDNKYFSSKPNAKKKSYSVVIPPPNVTGILHMGHMLNNTIQDVLVRRARMQGKEACWIPGIDHASIATEAKVLKMLKEEKNIEKSDLSREKFLQYAWKWKDKYGGIILEQLKKLGVSCDWNRVRFTMEDELSKAVSKVFIDLYEKGYIYRGVRMINWDPQAKTAVSDEEVVHKEVQSKLYYIKYLVKNTKNTWVTIATTRPETILADTAVCVNPHDERYSDLVGKTAVIPIINREVPIIADDYVDSEFGTGCLKVTPAHDINDYEIGLRHQLDVIDIIADDGRLNEEAGFYVGEYRFVVRKRIAEDLHQMEQLVRVEEVTNKVGFSERTDAVIEPKLSAQWFMKMKELSKPALENVMNDTIRFYPPKFKNTYKHWMENVRDWCISRQLWWGHRIPAYYLPNGSVVVAQTPQKALKKAQKENSAIREEDLRQDEDVLDTWFSSWLWPISVFDGITRPDNEDINYYYPTDDLVTAPEILFFWVARMIISGYEYRGEYPFKNVYLTGIVRDKFRKKLSKQFGNSPNPVLLMQQYGADGVRIGMLFCSPAGNDLIFNEKLCEQGRNFSNKIWNAFRLIKSWSVGDEQKKQENALATKWFDSRLNQVLLEIENYYSRYRISDALMAVYKLIWHDFCSWYLEAIKPDYGKKIDVETFANTVIFLEKLMKVLHPFMPFITEEIWQNIKKRNTREAILIAQYPLAGNVDRSLLKNMEIILRIISQIRNIRNKQQIAPKLPLVLFIKSETKNIFSPFITLIQKMAYLEAVNFTEEELVSSVRFVEQGNEFFLPLESKTDKEKERKQLQKELNYLQSFLVSIEKKLANKKFMSYAPQQVVDKEKQKQQDTIQKITTLQAAIKNL